MAHFAQLDETNTVTQVIVIHNNELLVDGVESEQAGIDFCHNLFGGTWKQTSYNGNIRREYATIGGTYNVAANVFIALKPYPSWTLDSSYDWQPPTPQPVGMWHWNEAELRWYEAPKPYTSWDESPSPYPSWTQSENYHWQPPTPYPATGVWSWNEAELKWIEDILPDEFV